MGEKRQQTLKGMSFNRSVRVEVRPERLSDNGGAVLIREALQRQGTLAALDKAIHDPRDIARITHPQSELLATEIIMLAMGWMDQDDADALRKDALFRLAVSERRGDSPVRDDPEWSGHANPPVPQGIASQPTMSRLMHRLADCERLEVLRAHSRDASSRRLRAANGGGKLASITLDIDALPIPVAGRQPGSEYNGYTHSTIYHPLVTSCAETGDIICARLRHGTAHAAEAATEAILDDVRWAREKVARFVSVRIDAGMPSEPLMAALENDRVRYVARLKNNPVLDRLAAGHLCRPVGRPPKEPRTWFYEKTYRAQSWSRERRVVLVVQEKPGELLMHHFWLLTNWTKQEVSAPELLARYRRRGTAEGHMGELKSVIGLKLSSSPNGNRSDDWRSRFIGPVRPCDDEFFRTNDAMLQLCVLAYNAMHAIRTMLKEVAPQSDGEGWSLKRLRERVLRIAARITLHGRRVVLSVPENAGSLWAALFGRWRMLNYAPT